MRIRYYLFMVVLLSFNQFVLAQKSKVKISGLSQTEFDQSKRMINVPFELKGIEEGNLYEISLSAKRGDETLNVKTVDGQTKDLNNGAYQIAWDQYADGYTFDDDISFQIEASLSTPYQISQKKHLIKSLVFPGLGDYKLRNKKHYIIYGFAAYASIYGSYYFNKAAATNYDAYLNSYDVDQSEQLYTRSKRQQLFSRILSLTAGIIWTADIVALHKHYKKTSKNLNPSTSRYYSILANRKYSVNTEPIAINSKDSSQLYYESALSFFNERNYRQASNFIELASELRIRPEVKEDISDLKFSLDSMYSVIREYEQLLAQGDELYTDGKYIEAIEVYQAAKVLQSHESRPDIKIEKVNQAIALQNKESRYDELISKADQLFQNKKYNEARVFYAQAIDLFNRNHPISQINRIQVIEDEIAEQKAEERQRQEQAKLDAQYREKIRLADAAFNSQKYLLALDYYDEALVIKRDESKPKQRKDLIIKILAKAEDKEYKQKVSTYAVIVGIEDYRNGANADALGLAIHEGYDVNGVMLNLRYTENDAFRFQSFLQSARGGFTPEENIVFLTENEASHRNIMFSLNNMMYKAKENDRVIFYFSGHGSKSGLCPYEYLGEDDNSITKRDIELAFQKTKAKYQLLIADACYSGNLKASKGGIDVDVETFDESLLASSGGYAVIQSSGNYETSLEDDQLKQGVFSYFLLKGLKGEANRNGDKIVTIQELFNYIKVKVPAYCKKKAHSQHPQLDGDYDPDMPMSIIK
ncbi:caspase family protein [Crocinitomicaceae bacterium]|nr:caspase family protein [Crocinitomicaceae bacterium]